MHDVATRPPCGTVSLRLCRRATRRSRVAVPSRHNRADLSYSLVTGAPTKRIKFKLAVLTYCAPPYLARELHHVADSDSRRRLRSASASALDVSSTRHRRPCLWRHRGACMEHSAGRRHVIVITACLQATPKTFLYSNFHA